MVLPNGRTVLISFLVTSPTLMAARIPPPLVMATTWSSFTVRPSLFCMTFQSIASVMRSPLLVSPSRLPLGAFAPLSSTLLLAKTAPYSLSMRSMIFCAAAATAASLAVSSLISKRELLSIFLVASSMTITPILANFVPVDWMGSPFLPLVITLWE